MQSTSSTYRELIKQSGRVFKVKILCTFADGTQITLTDENIMQNSLKISDAVSNEGSFDIGCAIINELDFEIDNSNGDYNNMSFENAKFDVRIGLVTEQKYDSTITVEWLRKGLYTAEEITVNEKYISIIAYDYMAKLDREFSEVDVTFPITTANLLIAVCAHCGVAYSSLDFPNKDLIVKSNEYFDEATSCRDVVSYIAQLACSYACIDMSGYLKLDWYSDTDIVIDERQKLNGTVTVTGVQFTDTVDDSVYEFGTTEYCLIIDSNPIIQGNYALQNSVWSDRLIGIRLTPFEATVMSDPSLEAGDIITIYDLYGNSYKTPITSITYQLDGKMTISCDAETINEKQRSSCSQSAKVIAVAKKEAQKQISEYDVRAKLFSELTANAMGYYQTEVKQDDGSVVCYQHNKALLADSQTIWKKTVDTIAVSSDGGQTWLGVDKDGNAVLKVLAAEGIIADWIRAGTILSQDGRMSISLDNGSIIFNIENEGKMILHTHGFTLYNREDKVLTSMFVSTSGKGVVTANHILIGKRDSETTTISEDIDGKGYINTDKIFIDNISAKNSGIIDVGAILQSNTGYRVVDSKGNEVGVLYVSSADKGICKVSTIVADTISSDSGEILADTVLQTKQGFSLLNSSGSEIGSFFSSSEGKAVLMLNGEQYSKKTATINGQTIIYLGV